MFIHNVHIEVRGVRHGARRRHGSRVPESDRKQGVWCAGTVAGLKGRFCANSMSE